MKLKLQFAKDNIEPLVSICGNLLILSINSEFLPSTNFKFKLALIKSDCENVKILKLKSTNGNNSFVSGSNTTGSQS